MTPLDYNYDKLKQMAADRGCQVSDLLALARQNDPFYCGSDGDQAKAQWFAGLFVRFAFAPGVHLRAIHYVVVSAANPVALPDGQSYENTEACWKFLVAASGRARYLGLVDPDAFSDRRAPDPAIYRQTVEEAPALEIGYWNVEENSELPPFPPPPSFVLPEFVAEQPYALEVWIEKSTMDEVLAPICEQYGVNLVVGVGELSITAVRKVLARARQYGKALRIGYVSDFDPAGRSMPVAVARKIEYFVRTEAPDLDARLDVLALTPEQVAEYRLPRTPIKDTEKRRDRFEATFGGGSVELDALEAIRPGELAKIVRSWVKRYHDPRLDARVAEVRRRLDDDLDAIQQEAMSPYVEEVAELAAQYAKACARLKDELAGLRARLREIYEVVQDDLLNRAPDIAEYPLPEGRPAREPDGVLFDSRRDYDEQLAAYKAFQGKEGAE